MSTAMRASFVPLVALAATCAALAGGAACTSGNPAELPNGLYTGAGNLDAAASEGSASIGRPFTPPADPGPGGVYLTISGEANAIGGYPFPPVDWVTSTYFVDGWELIVDELIVVVDGITLWDNPNRNPANQGDLTGMNVVAHLDGPFAIDLHKGGPLTGQGGAPEQALPIGAITSQSDRGGAALDATTTYAFGFQTVPATNDAFNVNLGADEADDYAAMVANGYSVLYAGHLTWKGAASPFGCTTTSAGLAPGAGADAGAGGYDYARMPNAGIQIRLGFSTPTRYLNCQNMALHGTPDPGESYPRGLQVSPSQSTVAQLTLHMDHPFWESFAENSPVHFDQIAAQFVGQTSPVAHTEDLAGVPFYAFTDHDGAPLPWRNCAGPNYAPPGNGQMSFGTLSVPVDPHGTCTGALGDDFTQDDCKAERDYRDFIRFTQSTQGHMNSQGLCFIDRRWPAPAGGS